MNFKMSDLYSDNGRAAKQKKKKSLPHMITATSPANCFIKR